MRHLISLILVVLLAACSSTPSKNEQQSQARQEMETAAATKLANARRLLSDKKYDAARAEIEAMRKTYYLAITAREEGIILMDSIDLEAAQQELVVADSLLQKEKSRTADDAFDEACRKVEFYKRKLSHDTQKK